MNIYPPMDFLIVPVASLEAFLKTCPDYLREGYSGAARYSFTHNGKVFAVVMKVDGKEKAYVDPSLLE